MCYWQIEILAAISVGLPMCHLVMLPKSNSACLTILAASTTW